MPRSGSWHEIEEWSDGPGLGTLAVRGWNSWRILERKENFFILRSSCHCVFRAFLRRCLGHGCQGLGHLTSDFDLCTGRHHFIKRHRPMYSSTPSEPEPTLFVGLRKGFRIKSLGICLMHSTRGLEQG